MSSTQLLDIVRYAPTGMNTQTVSWKVILDEQEVQFLSLAVIEWLRTLEGEQVHGIKGMLKAWEKGRDPILRKAPALIIAHGAVDDPMVSASAIIALATLDLAALSFGLGTCWAGFLYQAALSSPGVATALGTAAGSPHVWWGDDRLSGIRIFTHPDPQAGRGYLGISNPAEYRSEGFCRGTPPWVPAFLCSLPRAGTGACPYKNMHNIHIL